MGGWDCSCKEENKQHNHLGILANQILSEIGICTDLNIQIKILFGFCFLLSDALMIVKGSLTHGWSDQN